MKKILILILSIALFLHFFPQPEISQWYEDKKEAFLDKASSATTTSGKLKTNHIYNQLKEEYIGFSEKELSELRTITASTESVKQFYRESCEASGGSGNFHPDNLGKVCAKIKQHLAKL